MDSHHEHMQWTTVCIRLIVMYIRVFTYGVFSVARRCGISIMYPI